jgi:Tol biopolymer transport system component
MAKSSTRSLTADMLADLEIPHEVKLSPSAKHAVYTLRSDWNRPKGRWVSSLWIAEIGQRHSARQVTSGDSLDSWPQFSPDGDSIAFLSDRASEGVTGIWLTDLRGGEAVALTPTDQEQSVSKFAWSGDGTYIAFLSADGKKQREKAQVESKLDPMVMARIGSTPGFELLRLLRKKSRPWFQRILISTISHGAQIRRAWHMRRPERLKVHLLRLMVLA